MQPNPRQEDPQFQSPHQPDSEQQSQFGMRSQADAPAQPGVAGGQSQAPMPGQRVNPGDIAPGADVYGSDGNKVGTVQEVYEDTFLVQKGIFFLHDYYIPYGYVARATADRVELTITSEEAKSQNWDQRPSAGATPARPTTDAELGVQQQVPGYGDYGRAGSSDTIQDATNRGLRDDLGRQQAPPYGNYGEAGPTDTIQDVTNRGV